MSLTIFENKTFDKLHTNENPFVKGEYEKCKFTNCDLSNAILSDSKFIECEFHNCNLSMVKLSKVIFSDTKFIACKMMGILFDKCNEFGLSFSFDTCNLSHSSFYRTKIKKTSFKNCQLIELDLSECDLSACIFDGCDLQGSKFENSVMEKADFRTSFNYSFDPDLNRIKKAKFTLAGLPGLLGKHEIEIED